MIICRPIEKTSLKTPFVLLTRNNYLSILSNWLVTTDNQIKQLKYSLKLWHPIDTLSMTYNPYLRLIKTLPSSISSSIYEQMKGICTGETGQQKLVVFTAMWHLTNGCVIPFATRLLWWPDYEELIGYLTNKTDLWSNGIRLAHLLVWTLDL